MAENESLDLRLSKRWGLVLLHIRRGEPRDQVAQRILGTLQKGWQKTQKQLLKHGTSLQEVIDATLRSDDVSDLYRKTRQHDYVKLFQIEQQAFDTADALLSRVVGASLDRVFDQFRDHLLGTDSCPNVGAWNELRRDLHAPIADDIARFAARVASRPEVTVRPVTVPILAPTSSPGMVNLSLLGHTSPGIGARP